MQEVIDQIYKYSGHQRDVMLFIHHLMTKEMNVHSKISYHLPFFYGKRWMCYLNPLKNGNVEFGFVYGNELSNEQGILQDKGRKQVRGVELVSITTLPIKALKEIIHEAILLDELKAKKRNVKSKK